MHILDGLMAPEIWIAGWVLALPAIAYAVSKVNKTIDERTVPFMAILAAGIFVAQMLNFPVGGGTTGHLVGACLAAFLLGTYGAIVVMTVILLIQCLVFGDGGITALGLNLLNMAVIAPVIAGGVFSAVNGRPGPATVMLAAWLSVFVGAIACADQLALSYVLSNGAYGIEAAIALPTMAVWHVLIAVGEGIITTGVVAFLTITAPEVLGMNMSEVSKEGV